MRRIFTSSILTAALFVASFNSFAQCTFGTTAPAGAPGATNTFASSAEGFTGFTWVMGNQNLESSAGAGVKTLTTPIYFISPGVSQIIVRVELDRASNTLLTDYAVTATTNTNPSIALCSGTLANLNPNGGVVYYITIPTTGVLPANTNFRLNISFTISGNGSATLIADDFGTTASTALGSLPVKFSSVEGKSVNGGLNLTWNVASEENVARYEVERSLDNRNFSTVGSTEASGQDAYSFLDTKAAAGTSYYRVKAVDVDGRLTYSAIVTMKGGKSSITLRAFPMPVISDITVQHGTATVGSEISISSAEGRAIKTVIPAKGSQQTVISLSSLKPGIYVIRYSTLEGEVETLKIVKQ